MSLCPAFRHRLRSLWHQFFGAIALMEFVLKNPCQQLCSSGLAPCQWSYACPMANLRRAVFRNNRVDEICPEKPVPTAAHFSCRSLHLCQRSYACPIAQCSHTAWQVLGTQFFGTMALMEFALKNTCQELCSFILVLLPAKAICMSHRPMFAHRLTSLGLFWPNRSDGMCPENPYQQLYILAISLPPNGTLPKLFPMVSPLSTLSVSLLPSRTLPKLFPGGFPTVPWCPVPWEAWTSWTSWTDGKPWTIAWGCLGIAPLGRSDTEATTGWMEGKLGSEGARWKRRPPCRPPCRRFHLAPSYGALPKLFLTVSPRFPVRPHLVVAFISLFSQRSFPQAFPRFPLRPPCRCFHLAPSQRSSPQAISHGFPFQPPCRRWRIALPAAKLTKREAKHRRCFWENVKTWNSERLSLFPHLGKNSCQREPVPIWSLQIFCTFVVDSKRWYALVKCSSSDKAWLLTSYQGWDKHCQKPKWASIWQSVHCTICIPKLLQKPGAGVDPCHIPPLCNPETENICSQTVGLYDS